MLSTSTKAEMIIAGRCFLKNVSAAMARTATRTIHPSPPWNRLALYPNADTERHDAGDDRQHAGHVGDDGNEVESLASDGHVLATQVLGETGDGVLDVRRVIGGCHGA